jgi:cytosine/uracil/thiamine/allantoin permease
MGKGLIRFGIGLLSLIVSFIVWQAIVYALAISRVPSLMQVGAFFSYVFPFGWFLFFGLSVFVYYFLATRFLVHKSHPQ